MPLPRTIPDKPGDGWPSNPLGGTRFAAQPPSQYRRIPNRRHAEFCRTCANLGSLASYVRGLPSDVGDIKSSSLSLLCLYVADVATMKERQGPNRTILEPECRSEECHRPPNRLGRGRPDKCLDVGSCPPLDNMHYAIVPQTHCDTR